MRVCAHIDVSSICMCSLIYRRRVCAHLYEYITGNGEHGKAAILDLDELLASHVFRAHTHMHICQFPIYLYKCDIYQMYIYKPREDNEYPLQNVNICIYIWAFWIPFTQCEHLQIHMSMDFLVRARTLICTYRPRHVEVSIQVHSEDVSNQRLWISRGRVNCPRFSLPCSLALRGLIRNGHISSCYTQIQHTNIWKPSTDQYDLRTLSMRLYEHYIHIFIYTHICKHI